jgi:hypothetical protein
MEKVTNQVTNIGYLTNNRRAGENFAQYANLHLNQPRPEDLGKDKHIDTLKLNAF